MSDVGDQLYLPRKPRKCPSCGVKPIATILYGLPIYSDELEARLQAGKIELVAVVEELVLPNGYVPTADRNLANCKNTWIGRLLSGGPAVRWRTADVI